jgi:hypothetical protein
MLAISGSTLQDLIRAPFSKDSCARLLDRWALHRECSLPLRRLARFLLNQGVGAVSLGDLCNGYQLSGHGSAAPPPSDQPPMLTFTDQLGAGRLRLDHPTLVFRYSPRTGQLIEWRRWFPTLMLDRQQATPLARWDEGWLALIGAQTQPGQRLVPHRFAAFNRQLAPSALSRPFLLPGRGRTRATGLAWSQSGSELVVVFRQSASQRVLEAHVSADSVRKSLFPCAESTLELPGARALRELRGFRAPGNGGEAGANQV